jgi:hypothetical protein
LPKLTSLTAKFEFITDLGYREGAGHKLVSRELATQFEKDWRDEVRRTSVEVLEIERELLRILWFAKQTEEGEETFEVPDSPSLTFAILRSAQGETTSQTGGRRHIRRRPTLQWDTLVTIFGTEEELQRRIDTISNEQQVENDELFKLIAKYRSGWKPNRLDDD